MYVEVMFPSTIVLLTACAIVMATTNDTSEKVFTVKAMNDEEMTYRYHKMEAAECVYYTRHGTSICMDNYSFQEVKTIWTEKPQLLQYVCVNCKKQETVIGARSYCLCKSEASLNDDKFTSCYMTTIDSSLFNRSSELELVDLSENKITSVERRTFAGMNKVRYISLSYNTELQTVPAELFCDVPNLEYLGLSGIKLDVFPSHAFVCKRNMSKLEIMDISHSSIKDVPADSMSHLPMLKFLDLRGNNLVQIYKSSFNGGYSLKHLDISDNRLVYLFPHFCDYLPDLTYLHLSGNKLANFSFEEMAGCTSLISLDLSRNEMTHISGNTSAFGSLELFDISSNKLISFDVKLNYQSNLRSLNMSHNYFNRFYSDVFVRLENLTSLDLSHNLINDSDNFVQLLETLEKLKFLNLSSNKLVQMHNKSFANMNMLTHLYLDNNEISSIDALTFYGLSSLTTLTLDFNHIESLPEDLFTPLTSLKHLFISNNRLTSISALNPLSLISLDASVNALQSFPSSINFTEMESLNISHNHLTEFIASNENAFVSFKSLQIADLSFNDISDISRSVFSTCSSLKVLSLESNKLGWNLTSQLFIGADSLSHLNVAQNDISEVGDLFHLSSPLNSLTFLNISGNSLKKMAKLANIDEITTTVIESIDISNCNLSTIDPFTFSNLSSLRYVFLRDNQIKTFMPLLANKNTKYDMKGNPLHCSCDMLWLKEPFYEFQGVNGTRIKIPATNFKIDTCTIYREEGQFPPETLHSKQFLCPAVDDCSPQCDCFKPDMDSQISVVDCSKRFLTAVPTPIARSALSIYLDGSDFSGPDALAAFNDLTGEMDATELYLNNCSIGALTGNLFAAFKDLQVLHLSNNRLTSLTSGVFTNLVKLKELNISENSISAMDIDVFKPLNQTRLKYLDLRNNRIEILPKEIASDWSSLTSTFFWLNGSMWSCNCSNAYFKEFVSKRRLNIKDWAALRCKDTGHQIVYVPKSDFVCYVETPRTRSNTAMFIALIFTGVLFMILIAVGTYFRRELLSMLYYLTDCRIPTRSTFPGMHFDAFVCYNPSDTHSSDYLENVLLPRLRNNGFVVQTSADLIIDADVTQKAIEDSKCSLFIVNKNFSSNAFLIKVFQIAKARNAIERRHRVIILINGDVDLYALEPEMLKHLRRGDYITARSRVWWQRLVYEFPLPSGHRYCNQTGDNVSESDVIVFSTLENETYESI